MPRRGAIVRREAPPDAKYNSRTVAKLINRMMRWGKKSVAQRIVYAALENIESQTKRKPLEVMEQAIKNATPLVKIKARRVGGATYQVPVEVKERGGLSLAMEWLLSAARGRSGKSMVEKLAAEILDAAQGQGPAIKKREEIHKMAEANKAFAHYRW